MSYTPGPWDSPIWHGTPEDIELSRKYGIAPVPALGNSGERYILAGSGDNRKRVGTVDCQSQFKRGRGHQAECAERDANARLIAEAPAMLAALTEALDLVPRISEDDPMSPALAEWCREIKAIVARIEGKP